MDTHESEENTPKEPTDQELQTDSDLATDHNPTSEETDKQHTDAEPESPMDPDSEDDKALLQGDPMSEGENSLESGTDGLTDGVLDTDSQAEEKPHDQNRRSRRCNQWTSGTYATLHRGKEPGKNKKDKKPKQQRDDPKSKTEIILHLENENKELKEKLDAMNTPHEHTDSEQSTNKKRISELEAEIDVLIAQIEENDEKTNQAELQDQEMEKLRDDLESAKECQEQQEKDLNNLQQKIKTLEKENTKLNQENRNLKTKISEANKNNKKLDQAAQTAKNQKQTLEQVAQEKTNELTKLQSRLNELEAKLQDDSESPETHKPPIILLGDSNCRDIQGHLMTWTNQLVNKIWTATIQEAREWADDNKENLEGTTVVFLCGTNDIKKEHPGK